MCFLGALGPFLGESTFSPKEGAFLPRELGPFPKENSLLPGEVAFFTREFFLLHGELAWDCHLVFFPWGNYSLRETNFFKLFKCFMDFFIDFICWKNN
jgi:hypothetical protein